MSENPNPTRCGNCGTDNPPGQEFCLRCHASLTLAADATVLDTTPEALDNPATYDPDAADTAPGTVLLGGMGGGPAYLPTDPLDPEPDRPPRD
jgi:hypothetical protein